MGLPGDPPGLPGRHLQAGHAFPQQREPVAEVEGVGDQLCSGRRGHAQRQRERFGRERRHRRGAVPTKGLVGQERRPTERLDTSVRSGGVEVGPMGGPLELAERGSSLRPFGCGGRLEHTDGVEVADLVLLADRGAHGTEPSTDHRHSKVSEPLVHKGKVDRDLLAILDLSPGFETGASAPSSTSEWVSRLVAGAPRPPNILALNHRRAGG